VLSLVGGRLEDVGEEVGRQAEGLRDEEADGDLALQLAGLRRDVDHEAAGGVDHDVAEELRLVDLRAVEGGVHSAEQVMHRQVADLLGGEAGTGDVLGNGDLNLVDGGRGGYSVHRAARFT
jgi:hypothetical protein